MIRDGEEKGGEGGFGKEREGIKEFVFLIMILTTARATMIPYYT